MKTKQIALVLSFFKTVVAWTCIPLVLSTILLLSGCWGGVDPMLEDYKSKFVRNTAELAPQQPQSEPKPQPESPQLDWLKPRYPMVFTQTLILSSSTTGAVKTEWVVKKHDGTIINPSLYTAKDNGNFSLYGPNCGLNLQDSPLTITSTVTMDDGTTHTDSAPIFLFASSTEEEYLNILRNP